MLLNKTQFDKGILNVLLVFLILEFYSIEIEKKVAI